MNTRTASSLSPSDIARLSAPPGRAVERAAFAAFIHAASPLQYRSAEHAAKTLYPRDSVAASLLTRAAVAPAMTSDAGWAGTTVNTALADFFSSLRPISAAARLIEAGARIPFDDVNSILVPRRTTLPASDVAWVAEGNPIPAKRFSLTTVTIGPVKKLASIVILTRDLAARSAAESVVRTALREDAAASLDAAIFSTAAASSAQPAGLLNSVTPITATSGGGTTALDRDLENLAAAVAEGGGSGNVAYVAAPRQAAAIAVRKNPFAFEVWPSPALSAGTVVALDPLAFASGFGPDPDIGASEEATVVANDVAAAIGTVTGGTPATAVGAPAYSAWQQQQVVLRLLVDVAFAMRAPGLVQVVNGATWG
jgi:hypothetical protein